MFRQSNFRWLPEDPVTIALVWTKGRVLYETPGELRLLEGQLIELRTYASGISHAMVPRLAEAEERSRSGDWASGLELLGLAPKDVDSLRFCCPRQVTPHREVRRALRGWPYQNPFSQVWELQQMRSMYTAAENLLEDAFCDLVVELAQDLGWQNLSQMLRYNRSERSLRQFVEWQRQARGESGDARRRPVHSYPALATQR